MRASVTSLSKKLISTFFAATLVFGLVPAAAFATEDDIVATNDSEVITDIVGADEASEDVATIPAADVINETMPLEVVAQAEFTRSYFLAQTLESTRTVSVVSAQLPIDTGMVGQSAETEGDGDFDRSDRPGMIATDSMVVGSFVYRGITYAVEPGGESVAIVAADYAKLPEEFTEAQAIVLPSQVSADNIDSYSVTRIADGAFAGMNVGAASAAHNGQNADASSDIGVRDEPRTHEDIASSPSSSVDEMLASRDGEGATQDEVQASGDANQDPDAVASTSSIVAVTIPASVTAIDDDAFTGFETLQYIIVSSDNPGYSMYDGCLYNADQSSLLLIPEGRLGAVRIASTVTEVNPEVFSHCPSVDSLVADADSAAFQLLEECNDTLAQNNISLISTNEFNDEGLNNSVSFVVLPDAGTAAVEDEQALVEKCKELAHINGQLDSYHFAYSNSNDAAATGSFLLKMMTAKGISYVCADNFKFSSANTEIVDESKAIEFYSSGTSGNGWHIRLPPYTKLWYSGMLSSPGQSPVFSDGFTLWQINNTGSDNWFRTTWSMGAMRLDASGEVMYCTHSGWEDDRYIFIRFVLTPVTVSSMSSSQIGICTYKMSGYLSDDSGGTVNATDISTAYQCPPGGGIHCANIYHSSWVTFCSGSQGKFNNNRTVETYTGSVSHRTTNPLYNASTGLNVYQTYQNKLITNGNYGLIGWSRNPYATYNDVAGGSWYYRNDRTGMAASAVSYGYQIILYAIYHPGFTIKWSTNYTGGPVVSSYAVPYKNSHGANNIVVPASPTRVGYEFAGWYADAACTTVADSSYLARKIVPNTYNLSDLSSCIVADSSETVTFYAKWTERTNYGVSFETNVAGSNVSLKTYANQAYESASFKAPVASEIPAVRGYKLLGWSKTDPGTTVFTSLPSGDYAPDANLTVKSLYGSATPPTTCKLFAIYALDPYTITLNHNDGAFAADKLAALQTALGSTGSISADGTTITYTVRTNTFSVPISTKSGYTFDGWKDGTNAAPTTFAPSDSSFELQDYAYAAAWTTSKYSLKLQYEDAAGATVDCAFSNPSSAPSYAFDKDMGDTYTVTLRNPYRRGYEFIGWSGPGLTGDANKGLVKIYPNEHIPEADANGNKLIYTANWKAIDYTIAYAMNDGKYIAYFEGDDPRTTHATYTFDETYAGEGAKPLVDVPSPTRAGYDFAGWRVTRKSDGTVVSDSTYTIDRTLSENLIYTATWNPRLSVVLPITSSSSIDFCIDVASGKTQDAVEGTVQTVSLSSSTPVPTKLTVSSAAGEDADVSVLFKDLAAGAVSSLIDSLGFSYDPSGSAYVTAGGKLSFSRKNGTAGPLTIAGSQQYATAGSTTLKDLPIQGPFALVQANADKTAFSDLQVDLTRVRIKTPAELQEEGITGKVHLADVVWTVALED